MTDDDKAISTRQEVTANDRGGIRPLTRRQRLAVPMLATGASFPAVARVLKIGERTLRRWWAESPEFRNAVVAEGVEVSTRTVATLRAGAQEGAEALRDLLALLRRSKRGVRIADVTRVSDLLLGHAQRYREAAVEERLKAIEARLRIGQGARR